MSPELRAKLLALAEEMDTSPYESAAAFGWQLKELIEKEWPVPPAAPASPDDDPAYRVESHTCVWLYEPLWVDGEERPEWRCVKRWSNGERCQGRTVHEDLMAEARWTFRV
jgi:hypothetical protein